MKYTYLQYEYRNKWMHISWCEKFFVADKEHFDRIRDTIFDLKKVEHELIYPDAAAKLKAAERNKSRQIIGLYAGLGLLNNI